MSDTVSVTLSATIWTDVSLVAVNGFVSNESNMVVIVKEKTVLPDPGDLFGHTLYSGANGFYNWAGITGKIYARTLPINDGKTVNVAVTRS